MPLLRNTLWGLLLALVCTAHAETLIGQVVGVTDGDTLTVLDVHRVQHKVRLAGIDAPEKMQAFGRKSKFSLSELAFLKEAKVETSKKDRYGRAIGKVLIDGRDLSLLQIERGMAWFYRYYQHEQPLDDRQLFDAAESTARAARLGLWADQQAVPPWEFRARQHRSTVTAGGCR